MKKIKYLFVFVAVGLLLGACSKDNAEPEPEIEDFGKYSVKVEFDEKGFDPEWLIDFTGAIGSSEKKMEIEGLDFDIEFEEDLSNTFFYSYHFESFQNKAKKEYHINFKQKSMVLSFTIAIDDIDEITPSGKVKIYKDDKLVNSVNIRPLTTVFHPYED